MNEFDAVEEIIDEDLSAKVTTHAIDKYFPMIYGKRRTGEIFVRPFITAALRNKEGRNNVVASFEVQDKIKSLYRKVQASGERAQFAVFLWDASEVIFSDFMSDWLLENSLIASMWRMGWTIYVK